MLLRLDQYGNPESSEIFAAALAEFEVKVNNATEVMIKRTGVVFFFLLWRLCEEIGCLTSINQRKVCWEGVGGVVVSQSRLCLQLDLRDEAGRAVAGWFKSVGKQNL